MLKLNEKYVILYIIIYVIKICYKERDKMKLIKKILATTMTMALCAGIFAGMPIGVKAAGNIADAYVGTYLYNGDVEDAVTVTKDNVSIAGIALEKGDVKEVVVNDGTVPSVTADVALKISAKLSSGGTEPYQYFALSFTDSSHSVLKVTQYTRSAGYVLEGEKIVLKWGDWKVGAIVEYQRQSITEQQTQEVKTAEAKTEAKTTKSNDTVAKKNYSAYIYSGTTAQELVRELNNYINTANTGSTIEFTGKPLMMCYSRAILDKLAERGDVSLKTTFDYDGNTYSFTIPAGSDYSNLEDAKYYGFMYLCNAFNGSVEE